MWWMVYPVVFAAFGLTAFTGVALKHVGTGAEAPQMMAVAAHHDMSGAESGSLVIYKTTPDVALPYASRAMEPAGQDVLAGCRIGVCQDV